jgi:uncharacterized protein (TIGR02284 family)
MKPFDTATAKILFEAVMDSVRSFECVKQETHTFGLYNYSAHRAIARRSLASTLHRQLSGYGFRLELDGSARGSLHRLYIKLKSALAGGKRSTVRELVREETDLIHRIEVALASVAVPDDVAETLAELHRCISESKLELTRLGVAARRQRYAAEECVH